MDNYHIVKPNAVDIDKINFSGNVKTNPKGGKTIYMNNDGKPFRLQLPKMSIPYGVSENFNRDGLVLDLSFRGHDEKQSIGHLYNLFSSLDKMMIDKAVKNSKDWFGKDKKREVLEDSDSFSPLVRFPKKTEYPPTMRLKLTQINGNYLFNVFDSDGVKLHINPDKDNPDAEVFGVEDILTKGSSVRAIVQLSNVWVNGNRFGIGCRLEQMQVFTNRSAITQFAFQADSDNEEEDVSGSEGGGGVYQQDTDDEEEEEAPEVRKDLKDVLDDL